MGNTERTENVLPYRLVKGRFPENENELVLPITLVLDGRSDREGTLSIGDKLTLKCGRRIDEDGNYTQKQIKGKETFIVEGTKEYTVCGFIQYVDYTSDKYVLYGYTGLEQGKNLEQEEVILYYKLPEKSIKNMEAVEAFFSGQTEVLEVQRNSYIESTLMVLENSDYLSSVRNGLYLLEGILLFIGICIAGVNQYQSIREDERQIALFHGIGAEKKQLYGLFCMANAVVILTGFLLSFLFYVFFILLVRFSVLEGVRNTFFKAESFAPDMLFCMITLFLFLAALSFISTASLKSIMPEEKEQKKRYKKNETVLEINSIANLAKNNSNWRKKRRLVQLFLVLVVLIFAPVCGLFAYSTYKEASRLTGSGSADFYMLYKTLGQHSEADEELYQNPYIKEVSKKVGGNRLSFLPAEYLGDEVVEAINKVYSSGPGTTYQPFNEKNEHEYALPIIFIDKAHYNRLAKMNQGEIPPYEEFVSGNNCFLFGRLSLSEEGKQIDVGKRLADNMETIRLHSFKTEGAYFDLDVIGSVYEADADYRDNNLMVLAYAPLHLLEAYASDMYIDTVYFIDGYPETMTLLGESLRDLAYRYDILLQDNISESSAKKDALTIQYVSILSCVLILVVMSIAAMSIMTKIDYVSRKQTYQVYRTLGMEKGRAFLLQLMEQLIPFADAVLAGTVLHWLLYATLLRNMYQYYHIGLDAVVLVYLFCIVVMLLVIAFNTALITRKRYRTPFERGAE